MMYESEKENYSVCIAYSYVHPDGATYYKYYRVADLVSPSSPELKLTACSSEPESLYNPKAAYNHDSRDSDIYIFQWTRDPYDPNKNLTRDCQETHSASGFKDVREVITVDVNGDEQKLRSLLAKGIPFEGKTTRVFYLVYDAGKGLRPAIRCERKDFVFENGTIKLAHTLGNIRDTLLAAPRILINNSDIIYSHIQDISYRKIYSTTEEPPIDGQVLLRPLDYYAADYVKWFLKENSQAISKTERRSLSNLVNQAFSQPKALEAYLEAGIPQEEIDSFKQAIVQFTKGEEPENLKIVKEALLEDENFRQSCVTKVLEQRVPMLEEQSAQLEKLHNAVERSRNDLKRIKDEIASLAAEKQETEDQIIELANEAEQLIEKKNAVIEEIQSNLALQLGLKAVSSTSGSGAAANLIIHEPQTVNDVVEGLDFKSALLHNLKSFGLSSLTGDSTAERRRLADTLTATMAVTKYMAIPQLVADQIADSISIAICGQTAKRLIIPTDFRDIASVLNNISGTDKVVIIEGLIDSVNEGVLFSLLSSDIDSTLIFSFTSHASASLLTKEAWGKIFLPNTESFFAPSGGKNSKRLQRATTPLEDVVLSVDDMLMEVEELNGELQSLHLPVDSILLVASISCAAEELADIDCFDCCVAPHLLMSSNCGEEYLDMLKDWSNQDAGLLEMAKRLGIHES